MTIKLYPSRLPGEPIEQAEHGDCYIAEWFSQEIDGFDLTAAQPVALELDGVAIPPQAWPLTFIKSDSDVRLYPIPRGLEIGVIGWIAIAAAVASFAFSIYMMTQMRGLGGYSQQGNGDSLDLSPAKANGPKLGEPIREVLGRQRVYGDYVVQPISRFRDKKVFYTDMFIAIGVGNYDIPLSSIRIGNTPVSSFGDDVSLKIYPPGADVSADPRSENWYNANEVGNTTSGTAGLDLSSSGPESVSVSADAVSVAGNTLSLVGQTSDDEESEDDYVIPPGWQAGTLITIKAPDNYSVVNAQGYSVLYGDFAELAPVAGLEVALNYLSRDYALVVESFTAATPAIPGVGGVAVTLTASSAPVTYDFSTNPLTFFLTWQGRNYSLSLDAAYLTMSGIVESLTEQLSGSGLMAVDISGRLQITEETSPWSAGSLSYSDLPSAVFGESPEVVSGVASSGGAKAVPAQLRLKTAGSNSLPFSGLSDGTHRFSLGLKGFKYRITEIDGLTLTVSRMRPSGESFAVDPSWAGFSGRTLLDASVTGVNDDVNWIGPFAMSPEGESISTFEINLNFQSGLCSYNDRGNKGSASVEILVQYRLSSGGEWQEKKLNYSESTEDQIGFTEVFNVPSGEYEIRMRRTNAPGGGSTRDGVYWQALRSRLSKRPARYQNVTTMALTVRTGNRIAAQSDRRVNAIVTRIYEGFPRRSISGAFHHVLLSAGMQPEEIDTAALAELEATYWTPRGEYFDYEANSASTKVLDIMQRITNAGMGYFLLSDGLMSAGREGIKPWTGIITPHEMVEVLETQFSAPSIDDFDGVDVSYISGTTWATETVQCRTADNPNPIKVEDYKLDGVLDQDRAYRIGMRRLMKYRHQRLVHTTTTEMDARCYDFGDRVIMTDDIPGTDTISCLVFGVTIDDEMVTLQVSEPLDWSFANPRVMFRFQDGSASPLFVPTPIDEYTLSLPNSESLKVDEWIIDDPAIEPLRMVFCTSEKIGYDAILSDIAPAESGTTNVTGAEYSPILYQHDDDSYPGDVT